MRPAKSHSDVTGVVVAESENISWEIMMKINIVVVAIVNFEGIHKLITLTSESIKPAVDLDSNTSGPPSSIGLNRAAQPVDSWQTFVHDFEKHSDHLTASLVVCHGDWSCVLTMLPGRLSVYFPSNLDITTPSLQLANHMNNEQENQARGVLIPTFRACHEISRTRSLAFFIFAG